MASLASVNGKRVTAADTLTVAIRDLILSWTLDLGVQLKQEALAKRFGVSRIPVRGALKRLEMEGLVDHTPHQGPVVAVQSVSDLLETRDIRIGLETRALKLAIPSMTDKDIHDARRILNTYDGSESPRGWSELNLDFHMCLYRPCGRRRRRRRLLMMIEEMVRGINIHMRAMQSLKVGRKAPQDDHRQLLDACIERDVALAVDLLERHIDQTKNSLAD